VFPLRTLTGHTRWSLIAAGQQRHLLYGEIAGALVLLAIGLAAIPEWGAAGGAAALVGGILTSGIVTQFAINRLVAPLSLVRPTLLPAVAALAGFAAGDVAGKVADAPPLLQAVAGMAVFGAVALTQVKALLRDVQTIGYARAASA
jgi:O-antigen/teichoic acid export membrane protein